MIRLQQTWIPDYSFCPVCGKKSKTPCPGPCRQKLKALGNAIESQKIAEKGNAVPWTPKSVRVWSLLQETLDK